MKFDSFKYLVRQGWRNMSANRPMTTASVGVLTVCLIITGIAALLSLNVNRVMDYLSGQNEIVVYINEGTSDEQHAQLGEELLKIENVDTIEYISKLEALEQMKDLMPNHEYLLDGYETVLPASFRVTVKELTDISYTNAAILKLDGVESSAVPVELAGIMVVAKNMVNYGGWGLVAALVLVALIIISNTIRLTVFNRRKEINIMKFVGATNGFIRMPFFVEGITIGVLSGIIASVVIGSLYFLLVEALNKTTAIWALGMVSQVYGFFEIIPLLVIAFILAGAFIGSVGTSSSIRKHLRV